MTDRNQLTGLLLVLFSAAGYAFFPIFTKFIYEYSTFGAMDILVWRFVLATPIMWLILTAQRAARRGVAPQPAPERPLPRLKLIGMGALFAVTAGMAFLALERVPASLFTVLIYSYPALVALMSLFMGERLALVGWVALGLTLIGVILTVPDLGAEGGGDLLGVLFTLGNALTYSTYIVISNRLLRGQTALLNASTWSITGSFLVLIFVMLIIGLKDPGSIEAWLALIGLAVISTVLSISTFYAGMNRVGAPRAAIISTVEPVLTLILASLLIGETLQLPQVIGAALILSSVLLLQLGALTRAFPRKAAQPSS